MKATEILTGETYALANYRPRRGLPYATQVTVLDAPTNGKVRVVATINAFGGEPYWTTTRKLVSTWSDYQAAQLNAQEREEEAFARRLEREEAHRLERAELLNLLGDHGVKADQYRVQKRYDGRAAVSLTLEEVRALIAARPLALHFPEAEIPLPA